MKASEKTALSGDRYSSVYLLSWYKGTNTDADALGFSVWHFDLYADQIQPLSLGGGGRGGSHSEGPSGSTSDNVYGYGFTYFFSRDAAFSAAVLPTELRYLIVP
jgi:hypothetical protein